MKMSLSLWVIFLTLAAGCGSPAEEKQVAVNSMDSRDAGVAENSQQNTPEKKDEGKPKVFITLENKETGELKEVEASVTLKSGEKFFLPAFNPAAVATFKGVSLVDENQTPVSIDLDRVYLIEYWSEDGMIQNQFWSQMRQLEGTYKGSNEITLLSINYDMIFDGKEQIETAQEALRNFTAPTRVLFDLNDSFRDNFPVIGPTNYILIDSRQQITAFGRGDNPNTQEVFDKVRDALLYLQSQRNGGIQVVSTEDQ